MHPGRGCKNDDGQVHPIGYGMCSNLLFSSSIDESGVAEKQKTFAVFVLTYAKNAEMNMLNIKLSTVKNVPTAVSVVQTSVGKWQRKYY